MKSMVDYCSEKVPLNLSLALAELQIQHVNSTKRFLKNGKFGNLYTLYNPLIICLHITYLRT